MLMGRRAEDDLSRAGHLLQTGGEVDAVAIDVAAFDDDIAQVHADPELDPALQRRSPVPGCQRPLDLDGSVHGINDACELDERSVAHKLDDATAIVSAASANYSGVLR